MKDIKGYEGLYAVTKDGKVWAYPKYNRKNGRFLILRYDPMGYPFVILSKNGKRKGFRVHRLVAEAFISNPDNLPILNHKNGIKNDNRVENLEWCTRQYNYKHARQTGLIKHNPPNLYGEDNPVSKLKENDIREIRRLRAVEKLSFPQIASQFGVVHQTIQRIVKRETWKHIV